MAKSAFPIQCSPQENDTPQRFNMAAEYAIYLRKSRQDAEAEARGETDVLATHRKTLTDLAVQKGYQIGAVYEEVLSGDTIADRPQMRKLLSEVERGLWRGVLVMEIERLARGDSIDQGIVTRAFQCSHTYIITPSKVFDPNNYYDEEHLEFDLFMSRREYRMINRRIQAGRLTAAKEGRWLAHPPFGYDAQKLPHEKGYVLVPNDDAEIIRAIFRLYTDTPTMGTVRLCNKLNELGYRSATGKPFHVGIIKDILRNPVYAGYVTWGRRGQVKKIRDGQATYTNPRHKEYQIFKGRHQALISEKVWNQAQAKLEARSFHPVPKQKELKNPLSGLLICEKCGHKMQARPQAGGRYIFCHHYCGMVSARMEEVEAALLHALRLWLAEYSTTTQKTASSSNEEIVAAKAALSNCNKQIAAVEEQRARVFELLETGIYTPALFQEREKRLSERREQIVVAATQIRQRLDWLVKNEQSRQELIPRVIHIIETYEQTESAQDKNDMLRLAVAKIVYHKTTSMYSEAGSDLTLTIYPILPDNYN